MDSFGTEARFNYQLDPKSKNIFGFHQLNLKQYNTMFRKYLFLYCTIKGNFRFGFRTLTQQTFTCSMSTTETLEKREICLKLTIFTNNCLL